MTTPHKWADVLHAIADGKDVQFLNLMEQWNDFNENIHCSPLHINQATKDWRIKPEPKPDVVRYVGFDFDEELTGDCYDSIGSGKSRGWKTFIKITKSGETGEFTAEVIS